MGTRWLADGASSSGGAALARHFGSDALAALSARIDTQTKAVSTAEIGVAAPDDENWPKTVLSASG